MKEEQQIEETVQLFKDNKYRFMQFKASVETFFANHPYLNKVPFPIIHSIKSRIKDPEHLRDKLIRKFQEGKLIDKTNLFQEITDLIGIRILHLYQDQFKIIHQEILKYIEEGDWCLVEPPKAYTWDPESKKMYDELNIENEVRDTYYTSVHYVVKPNNSNPNPTCCEIQVRTLFEEIWGEIDHNINYPHKTDDIACKEQLRVLSKLVSTGTRLADSIFRTYEDHNAKQNVH